MYVYIYIYMYVHIYIYIYIYRPATSGSSCRSSILLQCVLSCFTNYSEFLYKWQEVCCVQTPSGHVFFFSITPKPSLSSSRCAPRSWSRWLCNTQVLSLRARVPTGCELEWCPRGRCASRSWSWWRTSPCLSQTKCQKSIPAEICQLLLYYY